MATATMALQVNSQQEMESAIQGYIAQGFNVANRTPTSVTLVKRKEFSVLWAVIGFIICLLPLLIYLIVYAAQSDQMVTITLAGAQPAAGYSATPAIAAPATAASSSGYQLSPDGQYFWDGQQWRPVAQLPAQTGPLPAQTGSLPDQSAAGYGAAPAAAASNSGQQLSPDGQYFWDGQQWRPVAQQPVQTSPLAGQSGPLPAQSGPLPAQSDATYPQQPQQEQPDPNQGQSGLLDDQGQTGYATSSDPGSGSGAGQ